MADLNVTYKGSSILTQNGNVTNKLLTAGKYLEDDITLAHLYTFLGANAELVKAYAKTTTKLSATEYNGWTPSTTAKAIVPSSNLESVSIDTENYEYAIVWRFFVEPVYGSSATNVARIVKNAQVLYQFVFRKPSNLTNAASGTNNGNYQVSPLLYSVLDYYNNNGTHTSAWTASYGIYIAATAPTFSNSTSTTPTLTIKKPVINARCSTTYFSTSNANAVTQASTNLLLDCKLYRMKAGTCDPFNAYQNAVDVYRNGIA